MPSMPVAEAAWIRANPARPIWQATTPDGDYVRLRYAGRGCLNDWVLGPGGKQAWATWNDSVTLQDIAGLLTGPILGSLLRLQGHTCLHGSVVAVGQRALAFLGPKGAGKSTTALALIQRGALPVSDDLVVLVEEAAGFHVKPASAALRLRPGAAEALCGSYEELRPLWSDAGERPRKRYYDGPPGPSGPIPLQCLYVLGTRGSAGPPGELTTLESGAAVAMLMAQRPFRVVEDRPADAREFAILARLAATTPVKLLERREGLESLAELCATILADAGV